MSGIRLPDDFRWERLQRDHPRRSFRSGQSEVDGWLRTKAWQHQKKHLSVTKVLLDDANRIVGYYTLATGQVDFGDLPDELTKRLPRRWLPVAVLAWLGVSADHQGHGLGRILLAQALRDCYEAGGTFAFVAVILDCLTDAAKSFYQKWEFEEKLKMSKQEVKDEFKQTEGDPMVKSRIKSIQRDMARKRMMAEVPKADVVITNPTRLAIAIRYEVGNMGAPLIVAKGANKVAFRIRELAKENDIPIVENRKLAQNLYKLELGDEIPSEFYQAVAEVLAYVYSLKK